MEIVRNAFENEKATIFREIEVTQKKLEEEIKLRLLFENKLNSLHHINKESESKYKILSDRYGKLEKENNELKVDF
jgi:hypothetical protein